MSVYLDNVLNRYETYTYNWALHVIHPVNIDLTLQQLKEQNKIITLAQTGVENEISIESVDHQFTLAFVNANRQAVGNIFSVNFVEVGGITFFSRIIKASKDLGIENHLKAAFIFELNFSGASPDGIPTRNIRDAGPFYYYCTFRSLTMSFQNGAAYYSGDLVEISEEAFRENEFRLISDVKVYASTFGDFLENFERELNDQARDVTAVNPNILWPNSYKLEVEDTYGTSEWQMGSVDPGTLEGARVVSIDPTTRTAEFLLPKGTTITSAIVAALMSTTDFRRIPVGVTGGQYAKTNPNNTTAIPGAFAEQVRWYAFETKIKYGNYNTRSNNYARQITYRLISTLAPQLINDPISHEEFINNLGMQQDKINNMFNNGQLKKRYDYIFTGKNTEVLDFSIALNNTYFTMQTTLEGTTTFASGLFPGGSANNNTPSSLRNRLDSIIQQLNDAKRSIGNLNRLIVGNGPGDRAAQQTELSRLQREQESLIRQQAELADELEIYQSDAAYTRLTPGVSEGVKRYITQSELYANSRSGSANHTPIPMTFLYATPENPGTQAGDPNGQEIGAAQIAAMYNNAYSVADLFQITLSVRGDPYWLGSPNNQTGANYRQGGQAFFLNIRAPRYPNDNTGLMEIENQVTYFLSGVYLMYQGRATYQQGAFTMDLIAYRDMNCQTSLIYDQLDLGLPTRTSNVTNLPGLSNPSDESVTGGAGVTPRLADGNTTPGATGTSPPGGHSLASGVNPALNNILALTGNQTGVTIVTTSGYRAGPGSGRHLGDASDIALYSGGRRLSVNNAADRNIISTFTQNFINNATAANYLPSVGWANHAAPSSQWYMGGNTGHYDIARGNSIPADRGAYWGNGQTTAGAPSWLRNLF
jgi:hypothetical protein